MRVSCLERSSQGCGYPFCAKARLARNEQDIYQVLDTAGCAGCVGLGQGMHLLRQMLAERVTGKQDRLCRRLRASGSPAVSLPSGHRSYFGYSGRPQMSTVLVAYVTHSGSTAEVAAAIGEELEGRGHQIDVLATSAVQDLSGYDAVVAGGLLYRSGWYPAMVAFLRKHQADLQSKPLSLFVTGLRFATTTDGEGMPCPVFVYEVPDTESPQTLAVSLKNALSIIEALAPRSLAYFRGKVDPAALRLPERLVMGIIMRIFRMQPGDYRNWDAIRAWARGLEVG